MVTVMTTTTQHHPDPPLRRPRVVLVALLRRWPTHVGAVLALASLGAARSEILPTTIALVASAAYLGTALVGDRRASWPFLLGTFVALGGTQALGLDPHLAAVVLVVPAALWWLVGRSATGHPAVQLAGLVAFAVLAAAAVLVGPPAAVRLGGVALILHALWDVWHLVRRRTVAPSAAEFCAALDVVLGLSVLLWL